MKLSNFCFKYTFKGIIELKIENISQEKAIELIYIEKIPKDITNQGKKTFISLNVQSLYDIHNFKVEISDSVTRDLPPKPKFNIKLLLGGLNLTRMDINEYHTNPEFDKTRYGEILDRIIHNETKKKMEFILHLMEEYSEYIFNKDDYHMHFYINFNHMREDAWAFPIDEFNIEKSENILENINRFCNEFNIKILDSSRLTNLQGVLNGPSV